MINKTPTDFDDLEDEFFANPRSEAEREAAQSQVKRTVERTATGANYRSGDRSQERGQVYYEACPACHGTGTFHSWSGRAVGPCFKCKGTGKLGYKVPADQRKEARERAAARKALKLKNNLAEFAEKHGEVFAWLKESAPNFAFAQSLLEAVTKYGDLSEKQLAAAQKLVAKRNEAKMAAAARVEAAPTIDISKIETAFKTAAANGLIRLKLNLGRFTFKPAPLNGRNAGSIYVLNGSIYLGKITSGKLIGSRELDSDTESEIIKTAANPYEAATAHGHATGSCSCCGRELTNPLSVKLGIGPICRAKWGWSDDVIPEDGDE